MTCLGRLSPYDWVTGTPCIASWKFIETFDYGKFWAGLRSTIAKWESGVAASETFPEIQGRSYSGRPRPYMDCLYMIRLKDERQLFPAVQGWLRFLSNQIYSYCSLVYVLVYLALAPLYFLPQRSRSVNAVKHNRFTCTSTATPLFRATIRSRKACQQEREYRTKIMIGGKQADKYGKACPQTDASSRYGTAQPESCQGRTRNVWRVHSGDVCAAIVPLSATVWLFGSGLLGLMV